MFKLVVLFALVACAVAKPGAYLAAAPLAYSAPVVAPVASVAVHAAPAVAVPTAYSSQSRTDVHHKGVVATTYTAPAVVGTQTSYHAPAVAAYSAPAVAAYSAPLAYSAALPYAATGYYGSAYGYGYPYGYHY